MPPKKNTTIGQPKRPSRPSRCQPDVEVEDDSGDHTSDQELDTDEDSVGSLVDFVVDDDAPVEQDAESLYSDEEVKAVELVESAVYVDGVRRSTRNRKPVERYVDSDYEDLMCADADPEAALESGETEVEEEDEEETEPSDTSDSSED